MMQTINSDTQSTRGEGILDAIIGQVSPDFVFASESFLLIVLSQKLGRPLSDYKAVVESCIKGMGSCGWTLLYTGDLEKALNEGHLFYSSLCKEEYLLYRAEETKVPLTLRQKVKEQKKEQSEFSLLVITER